MNPVSLSVIIPTHNRRASLERALSSLAHQQFDQPYEVIVSADSCSDGTEETVRRLAPGYRHRLAVVAHAARNAAATRNLGAQSANGRTLVFMDDDIDPSPHFVEAHSRAQGERVVVIGYSKPTVPINASQWQLEARLWWEDRFQQLRKSDHRFVYYDFFSGNFSIARDLFFSVGGFDPAIGTRLEDYEFGFRLLKKGAQFRFSAEALGMHHETADLAVWLERIEQDGFGEVQMSELHPELRPRMFPPHLRYNLVDRILMRVAFEHPALAQPIVSSGLSAARTLERLKLRTQRRSVVNALRNFNYWRGVARALGTKQRFECWREQIPQAQLEADVPVLEWTHLPEPATLERTLRDADIRGLKITLDGSPILTIPPEPGAEPLRLHHLESRITEVAARQLVGPLALRTAVTGTPCRQK